MRRQAGVFARQYPARIGDELPEQVRVLEIQGVGGEINLGLGTRGAVFAGATAAAAPVWFVRASFARHRFT